MRSLYTRGVDNPWEQLSAEPPYLAEVDGPYKAYGKGPRPWRLPHPHAGDADESPLVSSYVPCVRRLH